MGTPLSMSYDREAGAGYIALSGESVEETVEIEDATLPFGVNVDVDVAGRPVGIEFLGKLGGTAEPFLSAIADGSLRAALALAGYPIRKLEGQPNVVVRRID